MFVNSVKKNIQIREVLYNTKKAFMKESDMLVGNVTIKYFTYKLVITA